MNNQRAWIEFDPNARINAKLDRLLEVGGYPVLVHSCGQYPQAVNTNGETTNDHPYFSLTYSSIYQGDKTTYRGLQLNGHAGWRQGRRETLTIWESTFAPISDIQPMINEALDRIDPAFLATIPAQYDAAAKRIALAHDYPDVLSRPEYEKACQSVGVECYPDDACTQWGSFGFPSYPADVVLEKHLAFKRWCWLNEEAKQVRAEQAASQSAKSRAIPTPNGQLWEPCERCGHEPVYMPLHLCLTCWPTA